MKSEKIDVAIESDVELTGVTEQNLLFSLLKLRII